MPRTPILVRPVAVLLLLLAGACSGAVRTYPGPARPAGQVATIVPENAWNRARAGRPGGPDQVGVRIHGHGLRLAHSRFEVLPGRHDLEVVYRQPRTPWEDRELRTQPVRMALDAQAGRTYAIRARPSYGPDGVRVVFFAVDAQGGRTVAQVPVPRERIVLQDVGADLGDLED